SDRTADDFQDLRGGGLLLSGLFQFASESRDLFLELGSQYPCDRRITSLGPTRAPPLCRLFASTASLHVAPLRRVHDDVQSYANLGLRATAGCPLWVRSRHLQRNKPCPLYPQ